MNSPILQGPLAAVLTPRTADDGIDLAAFERGVDFVLSGGGAGVVVNGGTGEYAAQTPAERKQVAERGLAASGGRGTYVVGIGAMSLAEAVEYGRHAFRIGATAVLLPAPHFYRYDQADLLEFYREAAAGIDGPVLLYNLASFVTPIETETTLELIDSVDNIVGVKDSSGRLETVERMTAEETAGARILGHDKVIAEGLRRGWMDAAISGPTAVVPELMRGLFDASAAGDSQRFDALAAKLDEFLVWVGAAPYPWPLEWAARYRGFADCPPRLPQSDARRRQAAELAAWLDGWLDGVRNALQ